MKRTITLLMTFVCIFSFFVPIPAQAANVCSLIKGTADRKTVFFVDTRSRFLLKDKLTLLQTKGTATCIGWTGKENTVKSYSGYWIKVEKQDRSGRFVKQTTYDWKYCASKTIKLDKYSKYRITVEPYDSFNNTVHFFFKGAWNRWKATPTWSVQKTKGIESCLQQ